MKKMEDLLADSLILPCEINILEYDLPRKIISDVGSNFIQKKFEKSCKN